MASKNFTDEEKRAIEILTKAFAKCEALGIEFCAINSDLVCASPRAIAQIKKFDMPHLRDAPDVARAFLIYPLEAAEINTRAFKGSAKW